MVPHDYFPVSCGQHAQSATHIFEGQNCRHRASQPGLQQRCRLGRTQDGAGNAQTATSCLPLILARVAAALVPGVTDKLACPAYLLTCLLHPCESCSVFFDEVYTANLE